MWCALVAACGVSGVSSACRPVVVSTTHCTQRPCARPRSHGARCGPTVPGGQWGHAQDGRARLCPSCVLCRLRSARAAVQLSCDFTPNARGTNAKQLSAVRASHRNGPPISAGSDQHTFASHTTPACVPTHAKARTSESSSLSAENEAHGNRCVVLIM